MKKELNSEAKAVLKYKTKALIVIEKTERDHQICNEDEYMDIVYLTTKLYDDVIGPYVLEIKINDSFIKERL
jgi:hypothetical protein